MNNEVGEKLLPIGTVVVLKGATRKVMITGYAIIPVGELRKGDNTKEEITKNTIFDYGGCPFPEGLVNSNLTIVFNHETIGEVIYPGYSNKEQQDYARESLEQLETYRKEHPEETKKEENQ